MSLAARLILATFSSLFGAVMLLTASQSEKPVGIYAFGAFCVAISIACFTRGRAARFVGSLIGASVFAIAAWYLGGELFGGPVLSGSRSEPSVLNAVLFMFVFGLPGLAYAWRAKFGFGTQAQLAPNPEALFIVKANNTGISVTSPQGEVRSVPWIAITKVGIRTTDDGPMAADVFWGFYTKETTPAIVFPGGATGEQEIIGVLNERLPGFRNEEFIKAMGSTANAYFVVWESPPFGA